MAQVLEVDDNGSLRLPPAALGNPKPRARYVVEACGATLVIRPAEADLETRLPQSKFDQRTPEERLRAFDQWLNAPRPPTPPIPSEALRREHLYDERI